MTDAHRWWQRGTIYQVYPRSFLDSDGDGIGDLRGVTAKLDYLQWLGVDALWLSPIYPSPMADFGYDIADYAAVDPIFGTMRDFDRLLDETHARGLKLILDLVPNHTSDRHPWFLESRTSRDDAKRDWYLWRDGDPDGGPPNNWLSVFGGSAWQWDEETGQYYYHAFLSEQPDLNWRNPDVQRAMLDVMRFWLEKGVDGFRVDVMWHLIKDAQFRDNPPNPEYQVGELPYHSLLPTYSTDQPEVHEIVRLMRRVLDEYDDRVMIGEIYLPIHRLVTYYGENGSGAQLPFNFQLIELPWSARVIDAAINEYEGALPPNAWPNWVLGNHDKPRIATRAGAEQARVAAVLLLTLRGTPTLYYGDELGMHNVLIPPECVRDPEQKNLPGYGVGRDPERTPMQWTPGPHAGFTTGSPWLPVADDYRARNVEVERDDPASMLSLYRKLLALRCEEPALHVGSYTPVVADGDVLAYVREAEGRRFLIALNLGHAPAILTPAHLHVVGRVVVGTHADREGATIEGRVELRANEGVVIRVA
ncbi:MAG TPA: alpha-amylase family glycosyl hydrolase [Gemmatimonadaceae bacterium]